MTNNNQNIQQNVCYEENVIDLRELVKTITKNKKTIFLVTTIVTALAILYVLIATPKYEVKANIQLGFMQDENGKKTLVDAPTSIVHILKVVFHVEEKLKQEKFVSEVDGISTIKKVKDFIQITTTAISNEEAIKKNKEVLEFLQKRYEPKIKQYKADQLNKIEDIKIELKKLTDYDIVETKKEINKFKTQDIAKIEEEIKFYKTTMIPSLEKKIKQHKQKLNEYNQAINKLYQSTQKTDNASMATVVSIQMVNYQNLILNSQNKIEDYKVQIDKIKTQTIKKLEIKKENIYNDDIWKLEHRLKVDIKNKEKKYNQQIKALEYSLNDTNVKNSYVVGDMIVRDYPAQPKTKLIIIVVFITGLMLSVFLVFFLEFMRGFREENNKEESNDIY
jgi:capsular polysaccharide biosynthesis protein